MADKPSRSLVIYGDGLARLLDSSYTYIDALASTAICGFLSLPNAPSENEEERIVRELAQLLDSDEAYQNLGSPNKTTTRTMSERFMGMTVALVTGNAALKTFCEELGVTVIPHEHFGEVHHSPSGDSSSFSAVKLLNLLGFHDGKVLPTSQYDLVLVHVGSGVPSDEKNTLYGGLEFVNKLVHDIMLMAQPYSEIGSRLHLSLIFSYGFVMDNDFSSKSIRLCEEMEPHLASLFPLQSYTMRGTQERENVRHYCPMLFAQWQHGVTRVDSAKLFSFEEFKKHGANCVIPADRFLHEIAFKLWKAPKYGA